MAFQPETQTYEAGVYQLETTDPVQGGVGGKSNAPLLHLANRTAWLKRQVDNLLLDVAAAATANSPTFTGDPKAPTATAGDNDTSIATTAFVQYALSGVLSLSVAGTGSTTLTAAQAGAGVLVLTGALTGARTVVVPNVGRWIVRNATTGAFSLTVKTAAGTGVIIPQGTATEVFADGTNAYFSDNVFSVAGRVGAVTLAVADVSGAAPLASPTFTGTPAAPTPAQFDNDTSLATTAFVRTNGANMNAFASYTGNVTLQPTDVGRPIRIFGSGTFTVTMPRASQCPSGSVVTLIASDINTIVNLATQAGDSFVFGAPSQLRSADSILFVSNGVDGWWSYSGSAALAVAGAFGSSLSSNGWQRLPSGLIIQWGAADVPAASSLTVSLPIAFPNNFLQGVVAASGVPAPSASYGITHTNLTQVIVHNSHPTFFQGLRWIAIGY